MAKHKPRKGNGAREVLLAYFGPNEARICDVDHLLAHLYVEGYVVKRIKDEKFKPPRKVK